MHESPIAEIDAYVRQLRLILEEHDIARLRVRERDFFGRAKLIARRPWHRHAGLRKAVMHQPAAVEPRRRCRAAVAVTNADLPRSDPCNALVGLDDWRAARNGARAR